MSLIGRLRQLPSDRRKRLTLYLAGGATLLVIIGWILFPGKDSRAPEDTGTYVEGLEQNLSAQFERVRVNFDALIEGIANVEGGASSTDASATTTAPVTATTTASTTQN